MEFKTELANAVKLFLLLSLLFWSFTWNSVDFHSTCPNVHIDGHPKVSEDSSYSRSDITNQRAFLVESFSAVGHESGKSPEPSSSVFIPLFNEWKEKEMVKYEKGSLKDGDLSHQKKLVRRKLNYASSKCGAKVLASNPEARHRAAVLSEKIDEYMLNPCRVRTWFVIELCDTVEATQVELANNELFSSSPREFSVFWSEIYPTVVWHFLGTFEAKDQRTMQTFDLGTKNLGKFIKVIIHNHHGKEHYCPLSVIRVLGYSMVQKYEDIEDDENSPGTASDDRPEMESDKRSISEKEKLSPRNTTEFTDASIMNSSTFSIKICELFFAHCTIMPNMSTNKLSPNEPTCRFLVEVMKKPGTNCHEVFCSKGSQNPLKSFNLSSEAKPKSVPNASNTLFAEKSTRGSAVNSSSYRDFFRSFEEKRFIKVEKFHNDSDRNDTSEKRPKKQNLGTTENVVREASIERDSSQFVKMPLCPSSRGFREKCSCETCDRKLKPKLMRGDGTEVDKDEDAVDSAGLIYKESVLFKLTARIKASEKDLSLINKYLQQLSQSYRQQMEDTKTMLNRTLQAVSMTSGKAKIVDQKQEESIGALKEKMQYLNRKIDFLTNGQKDLIKRVVELHGFFLILELIVISTIFTIFLNIFRRKDAPMTTDERIKKFNLWSHR